MSFRSFAVGPLAVALFLSAPGCALLVAGAAGGGAAGAVASAREAEERDHSPLVYGAAILANCVYVPGKVVFAAVGAITSGVAYVMSAGDREASGSIWSATTGGTYVLTPSMIEGRERIRFVGP